MIRAIDIILSTLAIIILFPFMLPIAVILKCTGEHDIFYRQIRIGYAGKPFHVLKFATMLRNSPNLAGGLIIAPHDPRLLPMGRFLRKTKINELPQLLNIFIGQMSFVGYRPFAEKHYNLYSDEVKKNINTILPGLTGIGSIVFRNEEEILHAVDNRDMIHDSIITPYKGQLECWYVQHKTISIYFKIIFCTALVIFKSDSILWRKTFKSLPPVPEELKIYIDSV